MPELSAPSPSMTSKTNVLPCIDVGKWLLVLGLGADDEPARDWLMGLPEYTEDGTRADWFLPTEMGTSTGSEVDNAPDEHFLLSECPPPGLSMGLPAFCETKVGTGSCSPFQASNRIAESGILQKEFIFDLTILFHSR